MPDAPRRPLAEANRVTRRFGSFTAVDDVSIAVAAGEIVGLVGANGAGKTTLIRMLLGLLRPTSGGVALLGSVPSRRTRRRLGYVPQGLGLYVDMSVDENVAFSRRAFGGALDSDGLGPELAALGDRLVGEIGLGRQRQLAFACATAHRPDVLVLDEPTSGVDPLARARLWDRIRAEAERGVAVLVTTHYMQEAQQCDRLVMMAAGRVTATGTAEEIVGDLSAVEVTGDSWSAAFAALAAAGYQVTLDGRRVRVPAVDPDEVAAALEAASLRGQVASVPARLDEAMVVLGR
jgi:ABC-2 type transport system ATP-binding protein